MNYNEGLALQWMDQVNSLCDWSLVPDCEGSPLQQLSSAFINTQDSYAEGVVSIVDLSRFLRSHNLDTTALALLPPFPVYE